MATIIKDGIVIQVDLDSVQVSESRFPDCLIVTSKGTCGQLYDPATETFSNPEVIIDKTAEAREELSQLDKKMPRVGEDVIRLLIKSGLVDVSKLSVEARDVLAKREAARAKLK